MTQRTANSNAGNPTTFTQRAHNAKDETRVGAAQKARKNAKRERTKVHEGKRDRHQETNRNRR